MTRDEKIIDFYVEPRDNEDVLEKEYDETQEDAWEDARWED